MSDSEQPHAAPTPSEETSAQTPPADVPDEPADAERKGPTDESAIDEAPADPPVSDQEVPSTEELEEPSTEKPPGEEPKAPSREEPEPSHHAVGIGVIDEE